LKLKKYSVRLIITALFLGFIFGNIAEGATISGTVYKSIDGTPVTDAVIQIAVNTGTPCGGWQSIAWFNTNQADGKYTVTIDPGTYYLSTQNLGQSDYISEWWAAPNSTTDCSGAQSITVNTAGDVIAGKDFQLEKGGSISGTVFQIDGLTAITGVNINVQVFDGAPCNEHNWKAGTWTDQNNGTFSIRGVPLGTYYLQTSNTDTSNYINEWWAAPNSTIDCNMAQTVVIDTAGQAVSGTNFQLEPGGSISGTVYETDGSTAISNMHVFAQDFHTGEWMAGANADQNGDYTIAGLPSGAYRLRTCASCSGLLYVDEYYDDVPFDQQQAIRVDVTAPNDTPDKDFQLVRTVPRGTIEDAIEDGVVWLAGIQNQNDGSWGNKYSLAKTGLAVLNLEKYAEDAAFASPFNTGYAYHTHVENGLDFIFANAYVTNIGQQTAGNPDGDGDGKGVYFDLPGDENHTYRIYYTSIAMMAIAASKEPARTVDDPDSAVNTWTYLEVLQGAVDYMAWGQTDSGYGRGGWNYDATDSGNTYEDNDRSDQSNSGWVTLALAYAEHVFSIPVPGFVRSELDHYWIDYVQDDTDGGAHYSELDGTNMLRTGNLLQQMGYVGDTETTPRVQNAVTYIKNNWSQQWQGSPQDYHTSYTVMKGLSALGIVTIDSIDWFDDLSGKIMQEQTQPGWWPVSSFDDGEMLLSTNWALLTLQKAVVSVEKPDFVIIDESIAWVDKGAGTYTISYTVKNRGNAEAPAGHHVGLIVDQAPVEQKIVPALPPGATHSNSFDNNVTLSHGVDEVKICADHTVLVDELNEDNNCVTGIWPPSIEGTVTDANTTNPIQGASVTVFDPDLNLVQTATTDAGGNYKVLNLAQGDYKLAAYAPDYMNKFYDSHSYAGEADPTTVTPGTTLTIDFGLTNGAGSISGTVTYGDGTEAVAQAKVAAHVSGSGLLAARTRAGANGAYTLAGLPPGDYKLEATGDDLYEWYQEKASMGVADPVNVTALTDSPDKNFTLEGATVSGTVRKGDGSPLTGLQIQIAVIQGDPCDSHQWVEDEQTNSGDGTYSIAELPDGDYYLMTSNMGQSNYLTEYWRDTESTPACHMAQMISVVKGDVRVNMDFRLDIDTDGDGMGDDWETDHSLNPNNPDDANNNPDGDGLDNLQEYYNKTNPDSPDSDGDRISDGWEVNSSNTNPNDNTDTPDLPLTVSVMNVRTRDCGFETFLEVAINGYVGALPDDIDTITVTAPSGPLQIAKDDFTYYSQFKSFFVALPGSPEIGTYTVDVTVSGSSLTGAETDSQTILRNIPKPSTRHLSPSDGKVVTTKTPKFSWKAVDYDETPLSYRLEISDMDGARVYATSRMKGKLYHTLPAGKLNPGQTYKWRVRVTDSSDWVEVENRAHSGWMTFTMAGTLSHAAKPAIDPGTWGAVTWSTSSGTGLVCSVKVIDHDGVSKDGSSHSLKLTLPDGTVKSAWEFDSSENPISGYYSIYIGGMPQPGPYTFEVTDPDGKKSTAAETLDVNPLDPPDESTFMPANNSVTADTTPTFTWDPVTNAKRYRVRIYTSDNSKTVWSGYVGGTETSYKVPPGILAPDTAYRYRIEARDGHDPLDNDNISKSPASNSNNFKFTTGTQAVIKPYIEFASSGVHTSNWERFDTAFLSFYIYVYDAQGVPGNIKSVKVTFPDGTTEKTLYYDVGNGSNKSFRGVYRNNSYPATIQGGPYIFTVEDLEGNIFTKEEVLTNDPIDYVDAGSLGPANNALIDGTSVDFNWTGVADVDSVAFYRVEIYDTDYNRIYAFATTESQYHLPAGFLKEETLYRYRITARREFFSQNADNYSASTMSYAKYNTFLTTSVTGGTSKPSIYLRDWGVAMGTTVEPGSGTTFYYLTFNAKVTDPDGVPEDIQSVEVTYPGGAKTLILGYDKITGQNNTNYYGYEIFDNYADIPQGVYTFTVTDFNTNSAQATDELVKNELPVPANLTPVQNSTVAGTTPVIDWDDVPGAARYRVRIKDGWNRDIHWSDYLTASTYTVPAGLLHLNTTYSYRVYAYKEGFPDEDLDSLSVDTSYNSEMNHFTTSGPDADRDGMEDSWEDQHGEVDKTVDDASLDADSDCLTNLKEYLNDTEPGDSDTDSDNMTDGWEVKHGLNPKEDDADGDADNDGASNILEFHEETDPNDPASRPAYLLDQIFDAGPNPDLSSGSIDMAQTFTVSTTGTLFRIDVDIRRQLDPGYDLLFDIRPVDAGGKPVEDNNAALLSIRIPAGDVPMTRSFFSIDLSSRNFPVNAGDVLAIVLRADTTENIHPYAWHGASGAGATYQNGAFYYRHLSVYPTWTPDAQEGDMGFKTYVSSMPTMVKGDVNGDGKVDLADVILALRVFVGFDQAGINMGADVNGDGKIGLAEVIYILQKIAGTRPGRMALVQKWQAAGFETPESVLYDPGSSILYVSNIGGTHGSPGAQDTDGFISRLNVNGVVEELKWVENLAAPKGMAIYQGKLYVSDINKLVEIDLADKSIVNYPAPDPVPGNIFLNDVAVDAAGLLYVSDSNNKTIYRLTGGALSLWLQDDALNGINGLFMAGSNLIAGTCGALKSIDASGTISPFASTDGACIDGIVDAGDGNYVLSEWDGRVFFLDSGGQLTTLLHTKPGKSADLGYIPGEKLVLVPTFWDDNRVVAYEITTVD